MADGIQMDEEQLLAMIKSRISIGQPGEPRLREIMMRSAMLLEAQAKLNATNQGLVDSGRLRGSIRGITTIEGGRYSAKIVSFAVPYARLYEFGFVGDVTVRAHEMRLDHFWSRHVDPIMVHVREHRRHVSVLARPYAAPAVQKLKPYIIDQLRKAVRMKPGGT